jgi:hypothetical protein
VKRHRVASLIGWRISFYERGRLDAERGLPMLVNTSRSAASGHPSIGRLSYARGYRDARARLKRQGRMPQLEMALEGG